MRKIFVIAMVLGFFTGCSKKGHTEKVKKYLYGKNKTVSLNTEGDTAFIEIIFEDSIHPAVYTQSALSLPENSYGFIGYLWDGDNMVMKIYGVDTTKDRAYLKVALQYYRNFYTLDDFLHNRIKSYNSPISLYITYQLDSLPVDTLKSFALNNLEKMGTMGDDEAYFMVKIFYELNSKNSINPDMLDSCLTLYLNNYPEGKNAPRIYYFLISSGKINKDTIVNTLVNVVAKHKEDPFAERLIPIFADTTIKGNKNRIFLKEFLKKAGELPVTPLILQLSFYFPELFQYINPNDTINIYWRNLKEDFTSPPYLINLWTNSELITYHFARGYNLKEQKKYKDAVEEFKQCDNYMLPHYLKEEKDRQIIKIYRELGKANSKDIRDIAFHLLTLNPTDTVAYNVLKGLTAKQIDDSLLKLINPEPIDPRVNFMMLNGKSMNAKELKGRVWVIKFWSVYCPHCRKEIPFENQLAGELKNDADIGLLACSTNSKEEVEEFLKKHPFSFMHAYGCNKLRKYFPVSGVPAYFILNKDAKIVFSHIGESPNIKERLTKEIEIAKKF